MTINIKRHEAITLSDARQKFSLAIFLSPIVVAKLQFFVPNILFLRMLRQWRSVARTLHTVSLCLLILYCSSISHCASLSSYFILLLYTTLCLCVFLLYIAPLYHTVSLCLLTLYCSSISYCAPLSSYFILLLYITL